MNRIALSKKTRAKGKKKKKNPRQGQKNGVRWNYVHDGKILQAHSINVDKLLRSVDSLMLSRRLKAWLEWVGPSVASCPGQRS